MKCRDVEYLLVELADGTLDAERKAGVEEHLAQCEECSMDAALLKETFDALRSEVTELPPTHYFSTLLPKIRTRLEKKERSRGFILPAWLEKAAAPVAVLAMGVIVIGLFRAFEPTEDFSPLKTIVSQLPGDEMAALVTTSEPFSSGDFGLSSSEKILEATPNANVIADNMKMDLIAGDVSGQQTEIGIPTDDKVIEELDDETVSQVIDRMNEQSSL
jgi:hypothetical protein